MPDNEWQQQHLGAIAHILLGQSPPGDTIHENGKGIPFLQGNAEFGSSTPIAKFICTRPIKVCRAGDSLISVRAPVGAVNHANQAYAIGRGLAAITFHGVDPRFGHWSLKAHSDKLHRVAQGTTFEAVGQNELAQLELPIPPDRNEQRRIAEILDTLDAKISIVELIINKLQAVTRAVAEEMISSVTTEKTSLGTHLSQRPKNGFSPKEVEEWTGMQALGLSCLTPHGFEPRQLKNIPAHDIRNIPALLNDGDLLMSRANTLDLVGLVGIYRDVGSPCIYPDLMMRLTPIESCRAEYLELLLQSNDVRRQIRSIAQGTSESMVKINGSSVCRLQVAVPSLDEQDRILTVVNTFRNEIRTKKREHTKLITLKQGLMKDLLTGQTRVSQAEDVLENI